MTCLDNYRAKVFHHYDGLGSMRRSTGGEEWRQVARLSALGFVMI